MAEMHPAQELSHLRNFLARLNDGRLTLVRHHRTDVTKEEISVVRREIAFLEKLLARLEGEAAS